MLLQGKEIIRAVTKPVNARKGSTADYLKNTLFTIKDGFLEIVNTDGFVLSRYKRPLKTYEDEIEITVDKLELSKVVKILNKETLYNFAIGRNELFIGSHFFQTTKVVYPKYDFLLEEKENLTKVGKTAFKKFVQKIKKEANTKELMTVRCSDGILSFTDVDGKVFEFAFDGELLQKELYLDFQKLYKVMMNMPHLPRHIYLGNTKDRVIHIITDDGEYTYVIQTIAK